MLPTSTLILFIFAIVLAVIIASAYFDATEMDSNEVTAKVRFNGMGLVSGLRTISGMDFEVEVIESVVQNGQVVELRRPGKPKYSNLVLTRVISTERAATSTFLIWYKKVLSGTTDRKSGSIIFLDKEANEVLRYNFFEAWPCKISQLPNADGHIVEEIEFAVEKIERA